MYTWLNTVTIVFFTLAGLAVIGMFVVSSDKVAQKLNSYVKGKGK